MYPALQVHAVTTTLGLGESVFTGHTTQVAAAVAPSAPEYAPAPQFVHVILPIASLYVPAAHGEHTPPSGPVNPALQAQAAAAVLELGELELPGHVTQVAAAIAPVVSEYVPTPQLVHAALPPPILYVPAAHGEDTPPSDPVYPALQAQAAAAVLKLGELELPGHAIQVAAAIAPAVAEYVPTPQLIQAALPLAIL